MKKIRKILIRGSEGRVNYFSDLMDYRYVLFALIQRDVTVRYKQTLLGILWVLIQPLSTMLIFTLVFGKIVGLTSGFNVPYAVAVFAGILPWQFFSGSLISSTNSIVNNANLVSKVFFPRVIIPVATICATLFDLLIGFSMLGIMMLLAQVPLTTNILFLPIFIAQVFILSVGLGLILAGLNVKYRDISQITPFLLQLGLYASPIAYDVSIVPEKWRFLYFLNPMAGIIEGFKWALFGSGEYQYKFGLIMSAVITVIIFYMAMYFFKKMESDFADSI